MERFLAIGRFLISMSEFIRARIFMIVVSVGEFLVRGFFWLGTRGRILERSRIVVTNAEKRLVRVRFSLFIRKFILVRRFIK